MSEEAGITFAHKSQSPEINKTDDSTHLDNNSMLGKSNYVSSDDNMPVKISIILPTNAYFMSGIREFTMTVVQNITGFSEQWAYRFQSVVDELTNNAIEFGSATGEEIKITFISLKGKYVEVFIEDSGTGADKKTAKEITELVEKNSNIDPATITSVRGRGLTQIVASWTDVLEFQDNEKGGITVHAVKHFK